MHIHTYTLLPPFVYKMVSNTLFDLCFSLDIHCRYPISVNTEPPHFFITALYYIVCIYHNSLSQFPTDDHLGGFQVFATTNSAAKMYNLNRFSFPNKGLSL